MRRSQRWFRSTAVALLLTHLVGALLLGSIFLYSPVDEPFWWRLTSINWLLADGLTIPFVYLIYARFPGIPRLWRYTIAVSAGLAIYVDGLNNLEVFLRGYNLFTAVIAMGIANGLFALTYSLLTWVLWRRRLVPLSLTIIGTITCIAAFAIVPIGWVLLFSDLLLPLGTIFIAGWCLWMLGWLRVY